MCVSILAEPVALKNVISYNIVLVILKLMAKNQRKILSLVWMLKCGQNYIAKTIWKG